MRFKSFLLTSLYFVCVSTTAASYIPLAEECDGYPKLPLGTSDNLCVGLLAQKSADLPLKMPRTAVETKEGKLLVVDMGGWVENKGRLLLVDYRKKNPSTIVLISGLNLPHKILQGQDGKYYVGEAHRIIRFDVVKDMLTNRETVIDNLPYNPGYLHPLKNFVFDNTNNLIVNIGSTSDRCEKNHKPENCSNGAEAGLRQYKFDKASNSWDTNFLVIASGLRNSMALAAHSSGTLLQAENSMDFPGAEEPYEEINVIEDGHFYGWPLCYDRNVSVNQTDKICVAKNYREPWSLMPPHVAPLDALYYHHTKLPALKNKLLMTWHGYKIVGHRLVAFDVDNQGRPVRSSTANFMSDPLNSTENFKSRVFSATGGTGEVAQHQEIISRWNEVQGVRPKGAPAGIDVMNDGSLLVVDDKNAALLRVSNGKAYKDESLTVSAQKYTVNLPENIHAIFVNRCGKCHEHLQDNAAQLLNANQWLQKNNGKTRLEHKLFFDKLMPMPPDKSLLPDESALLKRWIDNIDTTN